MFRGLGLPRVRLNSTKKRTAYVISIPLGTVNMMTFVIIWHWYLMVTDLP